MLIGTDILDLKRIKIIERKKSILCRLFTPLELESTVKLNYMEKIIALGSMLAAKEAAVKALGTGFTDTISVQDVQIVINENSEGKIEFLNKAKSFADELGVTETHLAIDTENKLVVAIVALERGFLHR
ncbi:Phosphopantetheine-protein transferase [Tepidanaerobacter acetatoxydans Re1]|uniref:Phosphopantetheine-protein transferase n=1 Tax=Tepidanaerobacter acetatoxydans (strain DSM 21804 / JCM 16047 / Re1) TaxID=1209989 RepID=F4LXA3_TEPAE|nr:4'-phosphopantetheinyl transferase superfamily protein [Tepidanaerobacter acetatoxydans]AEE91902.1 phosphopantetheine-protein transferase [Tepidanaerobacter acetatoxydans Re1]CDI40850.1 Phosphopantetheine-protein transferase [Tepidanaerobacter acetatoxydans Re1]